MDKYFQEMLLEMNMIIIPGLGALSVVNRATGEIMFMPYLKHEDHILAKHIAAKEGWEENVAINLISKYVREIEAKLNIGESYDMYRFGSFKKDSTGDVTFESWSAESFTEEVVSVLPLEEELVDEPKEVVVEQIISAPIVEELEESIIESVVEVIPEPVILQEESAEVIEEEELATLSADNESIEVIEPIAIIEKEEEPAPAVIPVKSPEIEKEPIIEKVEANKSQYTEEDQWKDDLDLPPINSKIERPKKPIIEKAKSDKKKRLPAFYILTFLLIIVVGGSVTFGVFYDQLKQHLPFFAQEVKKEIIESAKDEVKDIVEEEKDADPILEEEMIVEETPNIEQPLEVKDKSEYIQTSTGSVNRSQPFHLIAGAFSVQSNAERFKERLRENGNANSEIIGQFDQLFIVSVGSYSSREEAQQDYQVKRANYPKAWIFQWP